jgi:hypothetical protein
VLSTPCVRGTAGGARDVMETTLIRPHGRAVEAATHSHRQ